jgi:ribosomal-protein-alanine N-acetyltransferase
MVEPRFRRLTPLDATECGNIWGDLEAHYGHPIGGAWTPAKITQEVESHEAYGVFDAAGVLMAFCLTHRGGGVAEILLLATRPREHRTGAMRALIRSLIQDLAPDEKIWLEVHAGNLPAIGLYEAMGFSLTGERKDYYSDGGKALLFEYKPLQ